MALSQHDQLVLGALFDSESSTSKVAYLSIDTSKLPGILSEDLEDLQYREIKAIRPLNLQDPHSWQVEETVAALTTLIDERPDYASAYTNRAQALRLLIGDDLLYPRVAESTLYQDLCQAIKLASPSNAHSPLSSLQAKILASAYTHRATILLRCSRNLVKENEDLLPCSLRGIDKEGLERIAGSDFQMGGKFGNKIAKQMAVQLNPYAKMCGAIVKEALVADLEESRAEGHL